MLPFKLTNVLLFQGVWLGAALLRDDALLILISLIVVHFWLSPNRRHDLWCVLLLTPLGIAVDTLPSLTGVVSFNSTFTVMPVWMMLLWVALVFSLNHSLSWLHNLAIYWQASLGALAGASSYLAAERLGALSFSVSSQQAFALYALIWLLLLPLLLHLGHYLKGKTCHENTAKKTAN